MKDFFGIKNKRDLSMVITLFLFLVSSAYLVYLKVSDGTSVCDVSASVNCSTVASSEFSKILGIPLPFLGLGYAIFNIVVYILTHKKRDKISKKTMEIIESISVMVNTFGALASLSFLFLQFFIIKAVCIFCLIFDFSTLIYTALVYKEFTSKNSK